MQDTPDQIYIVTIKTKLPKHWVEECKTDPQSLLELLVDYKKEVIVWEVKEVD